MVHRELRGNTLRRYDHVAVYADLIHLDSQARHQKGEAEEWQKGLSMIGLIVIFMIMALAVLCDGTAGKKRRRRRRRR